MSPSRLAMLFFAFALLAGGCEVHSARPAGSPNMPESPRSSSKPLPNALDVSPGTAAATGVPSAGASAQASPISTAPSSGVLSSDPTTSEVATFGAGCFWCVEAVLEQLDGVKHVRSGYMGGTVLHPTYAQVCMGNTGHAEVVQVTFDPTRISYEKLLDWFWQLHDPTTLNRQGNDSGTQYRSAIFYHSEAQRSVAEKSKAKLGASGKFGNPIVTEITAASHFYEAEKYHQEYYRQNSAQPYCRIVIKPKLDKLGFESK